MSPKRSIETKQTKQSEPKKAKKEKNKSGKTETAGQEIEVSCGTSFTLTAPPPTRNALGQLVFEGAPEFRPNLTPAEVLQMGSFGGTYFRPIKSSVTGETLVVVVVVIRFSWEVNVVCNFRLILCAFCCCCFVVWLSWKGK